MVDKPLTYDQTIAAAIRDFSEHGYDSQERLDYWTEKLRVSIDHMFSNFQDMERMVREALARVFTAAVDNGEVLKLAPGVSAYQLSMMRPELHAELQRRIAASADLIKLKRPLAIAQTMSRFQGWATSVPAGGSDNIKKVEEKTKIKKALASLPFEDRRVIVDQSAKLFSAINTTVAVSGGAIGAFWHSHKHQRGYNGRPEHNKRDGQFFFVPDSWAMKAGFLRRGAYDYTDSIEQPGEMVFCRCSWQYIFSLRTVPANGLTKKGTEALAEARRKIAANRNASKS